MEITNKVIKVHFSSCFQNGPLTGRNKNKVASSMPDFNPFEQTIVSSHKHLIILLNLDVALLHAQPHLKFTCIKI
jgi:hypothetical protein